MLTYTWEQDFTDITITFILPEHTSKKDISILPSSSNLKITLCNQIVLDRIFKYSVNTSDMIYLIDNNQLIVTLTKYKGAWWECIFIGDTEVDTNKLAEDNKLNLDSLDKETRGVVDKMLYEQRCKSDKSMNEKMMQMDVMEMLKKQKK